MKKQENTLELITKFASKRKAARKSSPAVEIKNLVIDYGETLAVDSINFEINDGELVTLLGPSGCGKTTTLNAIAGLLTPTSGDIIFHGANVTKLSPQKRKLSLVFQNYALYPHMSVYKNIAFPLTNDDLWKWSVKKRNMIFKNKIALVELKAAGAKKGELDNLSDLNSKIIDSVIETANYLKENLALKDKEVIAAKKKIKLIDVKASSQIAKLNKKALQQISDKESDLKAKISSMKIQEMDKHEIQEAKVAAKTELKDLMIAVKENITLKTKEINEHKKQDTIKAKEELKNVIANTKDEREVINENIKIAKRNIKKVPATAKKEYAAFLKSLKEKYPKVELSEADAKKAGELRERVMSLRQAIHMSVMEVAEKVDIVKNLKKKPTKLSGGQQQRVAIARGIVKKPKILLMDEPLSNLDAKLRISTREWIKSIVRDLGMTTIFVTHDQEEAMSISDKIVCMSNGHVQQVGSPMELYNNPKNKFVAQFLGMPEMKLFSAKVDSKGNISVGKSKIDSKKEFSKKETVTAGIRAEHVIEKKTANSLKAEILSVEYLGKEILAKVKYDGIGEAKIFLSQKSKYEAGEVIDISFPKNKILYFNKNGDRI